MKKLFLIAVSLACGSQCVAMDTDLVETVEQSDVVRCQEILGKLQRLNIESKINLIKKAQAVLEQRKQSILLGTNLDKGKFLVGVAALLGSFCLHEHKNVLRKLTSYIIAVTGFHFLIDGYEANHARQKYSDAKKLLELVREYK